MVDLGLRNITQTNKYDTDLGHKLENVVYLELCEERKGFVGKNRDKEVDFIVQKQEISEGIIRLHTQLMTKNIQT